MKHFEKKEFDKSKILFERDLVFNPKSEKSYLYLAKIFNNNNNDSEQEINLNSVLLLNPQNDEAIYMLTLLKIKQSDYNQAKKLINSKNSFFQILANKKIISQGTPSELLKDENARSVYFGKDFKVN